MNILEARRRVLGGEVHKKTAEGNPVSVRSLARMRPGLSVMGKSTQNTTTGAQLLDVDNLSPDPSANDITSLIISDGGYEWEETSAFTTNRYLIAVKPNTNYILSVGSITRGANLQISDYLQETKTGLDHVVSVDKTAFSFNTGELSEVTMSLFSGLTGIQKITDIMLCKGTNVKPWEPYTGGQPSPSPDYPQEITSAGDDGSIEVDVLGGNLFDPNYQHNFIDIGYHWGGTRTIIDKNVLEWASISDDIGITRPYYLYPILPNTEYIITFNNTGTPSNWYIGLADSNGIGTRDLIIFEDKEKTPFITDENEAYLVLNLTDSFECMLNIGSTALPFEPYKQPQSLTVQTPNGLPGIPVNSGGNYTDADGQQWICDEIDFKRGKYVQRVIKYTGPYSLNYEGTSDSWFLIATQLENTPKPEYKGFCNVSNRYDSSWDNLGHSHWFLQTKNQQIVIHLGDKYNTEEAAQQFIAENEIVVYYVADTPIETDLSQEQLSSYANLHTNRPTTIVSATDDAGIKLTYKTKKSLEVTD